MFQRRGRTLIVFIALSVAACGGNPSAPTPVQPTAPTPTPVTPAPPPAPPPATAANIGGAWNGRLEMTFDGSRFSVNMRADFRQDSNSISGAWTVTTPDNDTRGDVTGTLTGVEPHTTFSGVITWSTEPENKTGRCLGQSSHQGTATGTAIRWTSPRVNWNGTCIPEPTDIVWTLQRP